MTTSFDRTARLGAVLATAVAATAILAPGVHADASDGQQRVGVSNTELKVGCSYTVAAINVVGYSSGNTGAPVTFYDNGVAIGTVEVPTIGETKTSWRPTAAGSHQLTARVDSYVSSWWITPATVTVAPNTGTGSAACGFPSFSG
ncbi:hypothetical protein [Nocardia alba]|uniref:Ig-like domain-containing protein n=1 Tax=Nocardia alba TaxID=225051 RepID=A0A4R1FFU0_9NOCA|nr:hypothetical protein [Nocardia alba]TCJ93203.1 hypothetical protein DFR71_5844 [Nocardia alba]